MKTYTEKKCAYCGNPYQSYKKEQKCCSKECNSKLWQKNNRMAHRIIKNRSLLKRYNITGSWYCLGGKTGALRKFYAQEKSKPCTDCGGIFPTCCMDFDHVRGTKKFNISMGVLNHKTLRQIKLEMAKCELVCSNCHRIRTQKHGRYKHGKNIKV